MTNITNIMKLSIVMCIAMLVISGVIIVQLGAAQPYQSVSVQTAQDPPAAQDTQDTQLDSVTDVSEEAPEPKPYPRLWAGASDIYLIAHAGGAVGGYAGSNSLEALRQSAALGFLYIELDMLPTTDGFIVLSHVWEHLFNRVPKGGEQAVSHEEFMAYRIFDRFTPLDLSGLIEFLDEHPDIRIITDTKESNYAALHAIATDYPYHLDRFIPQAYTFEDIDMIRELGFADVILTLYLLPYQQRSRTAEIANLAAEHGVWGIALPEEYVTDDFVAQLGLDQTRYLVHTIDCPLRANELASMGFSGIYTGFLIYDTVNSDLLSSFAGLDTYQAAATHRAGALDANQRRLFATSIFYRIGSPIYFHKGQVLPVKEGSVAAPFESRLSGEAFLPIHHFYRYTTDRNWHRPSMSLTLHMGDVTYEISAGYTHNLVLYRDMIYMPDQAIASIFGYNAVRHGNNIALIPSGTNWQIDTISEIFAILLPE